MMAEWMYPWLPVAIPFVGAALGLLAWSKPQALKIWALLISLASLMILMGLPGPATGMLLVHLLPLAAFLSLLGQPPHYDNRAAWLATLMLLGLGLGVLISQDGIRLILLALL